MTGVGGATGGTVALANGVVTFTPTTDYHGPASFTYTITDSTGATAVATVSITVTPTNDAPVANPDNGYTTPEDTAVEIDVNDLLTNDTDLDGNPLTVTGVGGATGGIVALANGVVTFTPTANYHGPASFTYTISDSAGGTATVSLTVTPVNDAPVANSDNGYTTPEDTAVEIDVNDLLDNDTDLDGNPLTVTGVDGALGGTVGLANGVVTFTPTADYHGPASFTYTISDSAGGTAVATVSLTVTPTNDAPAANPDSGYTTPEDRAVDIDVDDLLTNDTDIDGNPLTVTGVGGATGGTVGLANGTVTFTPTADYHGPASFTYTISDGAGGTSTATVSLTVNSVNDEPIANPDTGFTTDEDTPIDIDVDDLLDNDTDVDGNPLTVTGVGGATSGTVGLANGVVTFTPTADYHGTASFTYTISDSTGATATWPPSLSPSPPSTTRQSPTPTTATPHRKTPQSTSTSTTYSSMTPTSTATPDRHGCRRRTWRNRRVGQRRRHVHPNPGLSRPRLVHLHHQRQRRRHRNRHRLAHGHPR